MLSNKSEATKKELFDTAKSMYHAERWDRAGGCLTDFWKSIQIHGVSPLPGRDQRRGPINGKRRKGISASMSNGAEARRAIGTRSLLFYRFVTGNWTLMKTRADALQLCQEWKDPIEWGNVVRTCTLVPNGVVEISCIAASCQAYGSRPIRGSCAFANGKL